MAKKSVKSKPSGGKGARTPTTRSSVKSRPASGSGRTTHLNGRKADTAASPFRAPALPKIDLDAGPLTEEQLRKIKTGLNKRDLEHYQDLLLQKRQEIVGDVASLETDRQSKNSTGDLSNMPLHMADVGTENYEQEFTLHLVESERKLLNEINEALERVKRGFYGVCLESGRPINRARLDAKPWARYSIEVAREKERRRLDS